MKKTLLFSAMMALSLGASALSLSKVREYARFLSDRMAYELALTTSQYEDCYEINYDFVYAVGDYLDDVAYGYVSAIDRYYTYLDYRNEDLSYVLSSSQYSLFLDTECFYRPFCVYDGEWAFRPYMVYSNRTFFYKMLPSCYYIYQGAHARSHFSVGFYIGRYKHPQRHEFRPIRRNNNFNDLRRRDFGPVRNEPAARPNAGRVDRQPKQQQAPKNNAVRPDNRQNNRQQPQRAEQNNKNQQRQQPQRTEQNNKNQQRQQASQQQSQQRQQSTRSQSQQRQQSTKTQSQQRQQSGGGGVSRHGSN